VDAFGTSLTSLTSSTPAAVVDGGIVDAVEEAVDAAPLEVTSAAARTVRVSVAVLASGGVDELTLLPPVVVTAAASMV